MSKQPTGRSGGSRRGGRFESRAEKRHVTSSDAAGPSISSVNPNSMGPVRILQSKKKPEEDVSGSSPFQPSLKSPIPRIATRIETKSKIEVTDEKAAVQNQQIVNTGNTFQFSLKLFDDYPCITFNRSFLDSLLTYTSNYTIVGVIGSQGCGKSTFASMLGGNEPGDMYGEYIFRPSSRDFVERGASQSLSVNVYISRHRTIIFDCQAINSGHLVDYTARMLKREGGKFSTMNKSAEEELDNEIQRFLMFLCEVCHTIVLGIDWFLDMNIIREVMKAQLMTQQLRSQRKVNLVVAQLRAKSNDFAPREVVKRAKILRAIFEGSKLDILGNLSMKKLGFSQYEQVDPAVNYVVLAEIKPRIRTENGVVHEDMFGSFSIPFAEVMGKLRSTLINLPKKEFDAQYLKTAAGVLTEKDWFHSICQPVWDRLLSSDLNLSRK